jgi:hypothetical protein
VVVGKRCWNSSITWITWSCLSVPLLSRYTRSLAVILVLNVTRHPSGYPLLADLDHSSLPEYYITVNGFFGGNGSDFAITVPAASGDITQGAGNAISGTWGTVGHFQTSSDLKTLHVTFNASDEISGSINFTSNRAIHYGCNVTDDPYFANFKPNTRALNEAEQVLYNQLGWAISIPGE